jgi:exodeoxyribonuclease VII large subunit
MNFPALDLPILSVSALTQSVKLLLEGQFRFISVQGEVSNCKLQTSGHLYFSLKDAEAQISAVMFKADVSALSRIPKDGDQVIVKGALNVYPPSGKYQIVVRSLELAGLGALLLKLEELKIKLKKLGFFNKEHKKPLPKYPERIGVVTSPTGAVIQDILNVLSRRFSGFQLILNPVKVQGEGAAQEIAAAIDFFNRHEMVDVMIVGRGGGSIEDLFAFNEEIVAQAIFRSKIPIISAVGHETDHCIADYVADVRAPTPSAAAEMVIAEKAHTLKFLEDSKKRLQQSVSSLIRHEREKLRGIQKHPLFSSPYAILGPKMQRLDDFRNCFDRKMLEMITKFHLRLDGLQKQNEALRPSNKLRHYQEKLLALEKSLNHSILKKWEQKKKQLEHTVMVLNTLDPKNLLTKGFSIVLAEDNSVVKSARSLQEGGLVKLLFSDGEAHSTINEIKCRE